MEEESEDGLGICLRRIMAKRGRVDRVDEERTMTFPELGVLRSRNSLPPQRRKFLLIIFHDVNRVVPHFPANFGTTATFLGLRRE